MKIDDILICKKTIKSTELDMTNKPFTIYKNEKVKIIDKKEYSPICTWYYIEDITGKEFGASVWSDYPDHLITKFFKK